MNVTRIEVTFKENIKDSRILPIQRIISEELGLIFNHIIRSDIYYIESDLRQDEIEQIINELLVDPVTQIGNTGFTEAVNNCPDYVIEVVYKPGVTDNVASTAMRGCKDILGQRFAAIRTISTGIMFSFFQNSNKNQNYNFEQITKIAEKILCNKLIEDFIILTARQIKNSETIFFGCRKPGLEKNNRLYETIDLHLPDEALIRFSEDKHLYLSLAEMKTIIEYYENDNVKEKRKQFELPDQPTDLELELIAQTWSEHCKHKIFNARIEYEDENGNCEIIDSVFKTYIKNVTKNGMKERDDLISVFRDDAGIVKFNETYAYSIKVETHNSPSALDPYGGAITGIVGVNRDILGVGIGSYPIFNTDVFCFADPHMDDKDIPPNLLNPRRIFRGVHQGIKDGGNESGIPVVNGSITFHSSFLGKPLVYCGTGGLIPLKVLGKETHKKIIEPGYRICMIGGRIGKDGIHGATFSSAPLTEASPTSAVQIGDPITQKKMWDFLIEARDQGLYSTLTDNGAGGLASSVGELATISGGARIDLSLCPLKYAGLKPWEILLSEAQERMSVAVPDNCLTDFLNLAKLHEVEATDIGQFTSSQFFEIYHGNKIVGLLDLSFLHDGLPQMILKAKWCDTEKELFDLEKSKAKQGEKLDLAVIMQEILQRPNIASKEPWVRQYDHEVQGRTIIKPFTGAANDGPSDGAVLKLFPDSDEGLVVTHGIIPRYSQVDTYDMVANTIDEAVRQAVALGADPKTLVGLDNFCWPDPLQSEKTPDGEYKLAQLVRACKALADYSAKYGCYCVSGKDSMKNDYYGPEHKISVLPTLLFTVTGKIPSVKKAVTMDFKETGQLIYLLGSTNDEMLCSELYEYLQIEKGSLPKVNADEARERYYHYFQAVNENLITACHDVSDGGLAVALCEMAFAGECGFNVNIREIKDSNSLTTFKTLFSESASRLVFTIKKENQSKIENMFRNHDLYYLGIVNDTDQLIIKEGENEIYNHDLFPLKQAWKNSLVF